MRQRFSLSQFRSEPSEALDAATFHGRVVELYSDASPGDRPVAYLLRADEFDRLLRAERAAQSIGGDAWDDPDA